MDRQTVSTADYEKLKRENEKLKSEVKRLEQEVKELKTLQEKYVWITREEMKVHSDIEQELAGKSLAQHDKEAAIKAIRDLHKYVVGNFPNGFLTSTSEYLEQLQEQE